MSPTKGMYLNIGNAGPLVENSVTVLCFVGRRSMNYARSFTSSPSLIRVPAVLLSNSSPKNQKYYRKVITDHKYYWDIGTSIWSAYGRYDIRSCSRKRIGLYSDTQHPRLHWDRAFRSQGDYSSAIP